MRLGELRALVKIGVGFACGLFLTFLLGALIHVIGFVQA